MIAILSALLGLAAGLWVQRAAARFVPVPATETVPRGPGSRETGTDRTGSDPAATDPAATDPAATDPAATDPAATVTASPASVGVRVPAPVTVLASAALFALAAMRFGLTWQLPAYLVLAAAGVLLAVIDLEHRLLPNRIVGPAAAAGAVLLGVAALADGNGHDLVRALLGAVVLFTGYLVMALIAPSGLGMGDVKLAGLLGLYLGWLGWGAVVLGAFAGFVVQAVLALLLLATRRIGLRGELPFGPAMLVGAALALAWSPSWTAVALASAGRL